MGSIAKEFVSRSLMLALFLSLGCLALPVSPAAQGSPEGAILEQKVKEATRFLQQRQREVALAQEQVRSQQRMAGKFAILMVKAKAQHVKIEKWQKAHFGELKTKERKGVHKKPFHCRFCS